MKTPYFEFDLDILEARVKYLKEKLNETSLVYALKANPFLVKALEDQVDRIEVCSLGEFKICLDNEISPNKLVISGVYKEEETFKLLSEDNIVTIESMKQFQDLKRFQVLKKMRLLLRLSSGNQFGLSVDEIYQIIKEVKLSTFKVIGLQYYSGTQKNLEKIKKEIAYLTNLMADIKKDLNVSLEELEYGPGLMVSYFNEEFNEEEYLNQFSELIKDLPFKLSLEIGRSLVASSGVYVTKVVDMKTILEHSYVIVDGGINHLTYYGQFMATKHPKIEIISKKKLDYTKQVNIVGSLCTVNDILVKQLEASISIGDLIKFKNVGAYSVTEGLSLFLSHDLAKVYLKRENEVIQVRDHVKTYKLNNFKKKVLEEKIWKN